VAVFVRTVEFDRCAKNAKGVEFACTATIKPVANSAGVAAYVSTIALGPSAKTAAEARYASTAAKGAVFPAFELAHHRLDKLLLADIPVGDAKARDFALMARGGQGASEAHVSCAQKQLSSRLLESKGGVLRFERVLLVDFRCSQSKALGNAREKSSYLNSNQIKL
jgi:hypothetical protein